MGVPRHSYVVRLCVCPVFFSHKKNSFFLHFRRTILWGFFVANRLVAVLRSFAELRVLRHGLVFPPFPYLVRHDLVHGSSGAVRPLPTRCGNWRATLRVFRVPTVFEKEAPEFPLFC